MATCWQKILKMAMLLEILIFRYLMFFDIHTLSILFNLSSWTIKKIVLMTFKMPT